MLDVTTGTRRLGGGNGELPGGVLDLNGTIGDERRAGTAVSGPEGLYSDTARTRGGGGGTPL